MPSGNWREIARLTSASIGGGATDSDELGADVTLAATNTFYDGPSVSLAAGTWFVDAQVLLRMEVDAGTTKAYTAKLWDGSTAYAATQFTKSSSVDVHAALHCSAIITLGTTTTIKISVAADAVDTVGSGDKILVAPSSNSPGNLASFIRAVKVG